MAEFDDLRKAIGEARARREKAEESLFAARTERQKIEDRIRRLLRSRRQDDPATERELSGLRQRSATLSGDAQRLREEHGRRRAEEGAVLGAFSRFTDPREQLGRLDDRFPILLFPLRIETRFKQDASGAPQLWVRVYPDDIAVDTFEDTLAEVEVRNAKAYWTSVWKAGGVDGEKRAAWRTLAASHGAGRAHWILQRVVPQNPDEEPRKAEGEHVLVILADAALLASERPSVASYWRRVWLGNGAAEGEAEALAALVEELGEARAAAIREGYVPANLAERPATAVAEVKVAFLDLTGAGRLPTQTQPWGRPARARLLPERLVLLGYNGPDNTLQQLGNPIPADLTLGPDPGAGPEGQIRVEGDELVVPETMRWLVDFEDALEKGMAFRVPLDAVQARRGFDQIVVLGVGLGAGAQAGREQLETLIRHHQASRKGFSIARQGMPTNNTDEQASGYTWLEDADLSYDHFFGQEAAEDSSDWRRKRDGRWLAEYLGVDPAVLRDSVNYFAQDQCDAKQMNLALWPATLGYFMDRMMAPVFDDQAVDATRAFFNRFVSGRGAVPAIRVGAQPYGILPATAFSRMDWVRRLAQDGRFARWQEEFGGTAFLQRLHAVLRTIDQDWAALAAQSPFVGGPGDPHQTLLDVLGLHPASVEFHQRFAQSREQLFNQFRYYGLGGAFVAALIAAGYTQSGLNLLQRLGAAGSLESVPEILSKFFLNSAERLDGPVVDDPPPSETEPLRPSRASGDNYIDWLIQAARTSHDALRRQDGFLDEQPPTALLYLTLRHALDLSYVDVSLALHVRADLLSAAQARLARMDPRFIHVQAEAADLGSPWSYLYKAEPLITQHPEQRIGEFVPTILTVERPYLQAQIEALEHLASVPTARLERAFAEHLDCCSYRFDAWWLALVELQLSYLRTAAGEDDDAGPGTYLGAFGWLEDVRPENKVLDPVSLPPELAAKFDRPGAPPLRKDRSNAGHILAPSQSHAVTAAVLRNGYLSNATPDNPDTLAVNLTSQRVRQALAVLEGIRNGQSLGALLGYQLERGLHDQGTLFLDDIILELRRAFPLVANKTRGTREPDAAILAIEARNVVDGLALVEKVEETGVRTYPFGVAGLPDIPDPQRRDAVDRVVEGLLDVRDALSDLAMAESVHQIVQGNYDRAAGTLDAYSKASFPPLPEVVQTPRSGVTLTHRVGLQLEGGLDPADPANLSPRAKGEPALDRWLAGMLPDPAQVVCRVEFFDRDLGATATPTLSAAQLGLMPIDLLYMVTLDDAQAMTALDDAILHQVVTAHHPRLDSPITIQYTAPVAGSVTFFELAALVRSLRGLLLRSRPLRPSDVRLQQEARKADDSSGAIDPARIALVRADLQAALGPWTALVAALTTTLSGADEPAIVASAVADVDQRIDELLEAAHALSRFGFAKAGIGDSLEWRRLQFAALAAKVDELVERWDEKLDRFDQLLLDYDALEPSVANAERFAALATLERVLSTVPRQPAPASPALFRTHVETVVRPGFVAARDGLRAILGATTLSQAHTELAALMPEVEAHDVVGLDAGDQRREIRRYLGQLKDRAQQTVADVEDRIARADALVAEAAGTSPAARVDLLTQAARTLLDQEFVILPEYSVPQVVAAELSNAWTARSALLQHVRDTLQKDFPVDEWLYGVARVRDKMKQLESTVMLTEALAGGALELEPVQLPYRADDVWLGLEYPDVHPGSDEPFRIDEDKLLYTAHYTVPFDAGRPQCGLLLDEWTEVIPNREETVGLAFHYDRPNSEPPQALLLVTPADLTGGWRWADVVDAVRETLALARKRAVEPAQVDQTAYARFLPALISSVTTYPVMQSLNLAFNNRIQFRETP